MNIIGIVALKLNHSLSHVIHNYWIDQVKTKFQFKKYELKENDIELFINMFAVNAEQFDYSSFLNVDVKETKTSNLILPGQ